MSRAEPTRTPAAPQGDSAELIERLGVEAIALLQRRHARAGWLMQEAAQALAAKEAEIAALRGDKARLDYLQSESLDLRCFDVPTGGGDADVGWRIVGHWRAEPRERTVAEVFHDSLRDAIDTARALLSTPEQGKPVSDGEAG